MEYLNKYNCKRLTGYPFADILRLSGILGIHSAEELKSISVIYSQIDIEGRIVTVEFQTDLLDEFIIRINLADKTIKDEKFFSSGKKKGISFDWLVCQIETAKKLGFTRISLDAYKEKGNPKITGYIVWGRYGFVMTAKKDKLYFKNKMKELYDNQVISTNYRNLFELLHSKDANVWGDEHGIDWLGEFDLSPSSASTKNFEKLKKKRL